jgi:hypothetical protein
MAHVRPEGHARGVKINTFCHILYPILNVNKYRLIAPLIRHIKSIIVYIVYPGLENDLLKSFKCSNMDKNTINTKKAIKT